MDNLLRKLGYLGPKQEVDLRLYVQEEEGFSIYMELKGDDNKPRFKHSFPREEFGVVWAVIAEKILTYTLCVTRVQIDQSLFCPQVATILKNPNSCIKYLNIRHVPSERVSAEVLKVMDTNTCRLLYIRLFMSLDSVEDLDAQEMWIITANKFERKQVNCIPVQNQVFTLLNIRVLPVDLVHMLSELLI